MLFQKGLNVAGMPRATWLTTRTPVILGDRRQESARHLGKTGALVHSLVAPRCLQALLPKRIEGLKHVVLRITLGMWV